MSIPTTCGQRRDVLFHVLFGGNMEYIARLIEESVINVSREYENHSGVAEALQLMRPVEGDSLSKLQIKFFLLLNEDETMRRNLSNVKIKGKGSLMTVGSLCPHKAERFYDSLCDELIPVWIKDSRIAHDAFVDTLRKSYLCS
jgi:hypothetical protein